MHSHLRSFKTRISACGPHYLEGSATPGSSASAPVDLSSPEVTIVGSATLSQKLKFMNKALEADYNSKLQNPVSTSVSARNSLSKTRGYPYLSPIHVGQSSSKYDFKPSASSTGGKVPLHGPRRVVKPSYVLKSDEYELGRVNFKVSESQILNYKAICNLAMSSHSRLHAINRGGVHCTFGALGESMKPDGIVNNFVMASWCFYLYSKPSGNPNVSKCYFFFPNIGEQLLKDVRNAKEDTLTNAFTRPTKSRPLHRCDLMFFPCSHDDHWFVFIVDVKNQKFVFLDSYHVEQSDFQCEMRDKLIPNFKFWWEKIVNLDMGFHMYKPSYPSVPRQPAYMVNDSGVYVMMFLEYWKSPRTVLYSLFKASDIPNLRIKIANELVFSPNNNGHKELISNYQFVINEDE